MAIGKIIRFIFTGDADPLEKSAKKGTKSLEDMRKEFREGISTAAKWSAGIAAAGGAIGIHLINQSREAIDNQAKLASSLNTTSASLATMKRAGDLSGVAMSGIEQATKDLTRRLSQAATGTGPAVDALKNLNLNAEDLMKLPLDERVATINKAIRDFVPAAQQAAVAGQLFGEEGSIAMSRISPETIAQAKDETVALGLALSEVDAAKVEQANDSFSRIQAGIDGVIQQTTVELAPALDLMGQMFFDSAKEAGGLAEQGKTAADTIIDGVAFAIDAVEGLRRIFVVAGQGIATGVLGIQKSMLEIVQAIVEGPIDALNELIEIANAVPGVNIPTIEQPDFVSGLEQQIDLAEGAVAAGVEAMKATLAEPLPGEGFKQMVRDAQEAAEQTAKATVEARESMSSLSPEEGGLSGAELEKLKEDIAKRLEIVRTGHLSEIEALREKKASELEVVKEALANELLTEEEANTYKEQIATDHESKINEIEKRAADERTRIAEMEQRAKFQAASNALSSISTLMNTESRKQFEIGKSAALAQALVDGYAAVVGAYKIGASLGGPYLGAAYATAAGLATAAQIQSIRKQQFGSGGGAAVTGSVTTAINADTQGTRSPGGSSGGGTLRVEGLDDDALFTGGTVRRLAERLRQHMDDGGDVEFVKP